MKPILLSCTEASADLLASEVVRSVRARTPDARFIGIAGTRSRSAGAATTHDVSELSVMGFTEVVPKLFQILRLMKDLEALAVAEGVETALLVDAPDFNLRLAKRLKRRGIRVVYYVSPTVWAWRPGRVELIRRHVDELCCIFPFEVDWYAERGLKVHFVGHPLLDTRPAPEAGPKLRRQLLGAAEGPLVALLPGSRRFEIRNLLPPMLEAAKLVAREAPGTGFVLPLAPTIPRAMVDAMCETAHFQPKIIEGQAAEALLAADAAAVALGTATLEAALAKAPHVIVYRTSFVSFVIYKLFLRIKQLGLPNVIAGRKVVPELMQYDVTPVAIARELRGLIGNLTVRAQLKEVAGKLGDPGAGNRVADVLLARPA